jgi:hypothetical protein
MQVNAFVSAEQARLSGHERVWRLAFCGWILSDDCGTCMRRSAALLLGQQSYSDRGIHHELMVETILYIRSLRRVARMRDERQRKRRCWRSVSEHENGGDQLHESGN